MATIDINVNYTIRNLEQDDIDLLHDGLESLAKRHGDKTISDAIEDLKRIFYGHIT